MADLKRQGVDVVVSCLTAPEELELGLTREEHAASEQGLVFAPFRIEDRRTPADSSTCAAAVATPAAPAAHHSGHIRVEGTRGRLRSGIRAIHPVWQV